MTLTSKQMKRAAREARKLAYEYAEGRGPELFHRDYCGCVAGRLAKRSDLGWPAAVTLDRGGTLTAATNRQCSSVDPVPGAVVFPLLALADELEHAAKAAPKASP